MICEVCQTPISDEYNTDPQGEPVHPGECYREAYGDVYRVGRDE